MRPLLMVLILAAKHSIARAFTIVATRSKLTFTTVRSISIPRRTTTMSAVNGDFPTEMTDDERYLFDLNGFIIVRGVLTPEEVKQANDAIDNHKHEMVERS